MYGDTVQIALVDPLNPQVIDELGFTVKHQIQLVVADPAAVLKAIEKFYPAQAGGGVGGGYADLLKELGSTMDLSAVEDGKTGVLMKLDDAVNDAPIVKFVNLVLMQAMQDRASDIHFEPFEDEFKIRYRVDGALYEMSPPPKHLADAGDLAHQGHGEPEHLRAPPAAGRPHLGDHRRASRSTCVSRPCPTAFGESVVLRVLDRSAVSLDLETLGLPKTIYRLHHRDDQPAERHLRRHRPDRLAARPPRSTPACAGSTRSTPRCSRPRTRSSTTSRASCRCR